MREEIWSLSFLGATLLRKGFEAALYNIWLHSRYGNQKWFVSFSVVLRSQLQPPLQEVLSARGGEGGSEASPLYVHRRVGLSVCSCLWRLQLSSLSGAFAYHKHVGRASINAPTWLYKTKYVTVTTWRQEPWLSPRPYGYLNLLTLKSASWLQLSSCAALRKCLAESLKMNFQATYYLADGRSMFCCCWTLSGQRGHWFLLMFMPWGRG